VTDTQHAPSPVTATHPEATGPLRYLPAVELEKCLPDVPRRIDLAARALVALARGEAEMPPKIGVHPRPGALLHAMPAWLRGDDLVGLKWVSAFPENRRRGLPAIGGLVVLNDADTGIPTWIMGAGRITAVRTAAVSGVAMRLLAPASVSVVAVLGAGVQARSHLEIVAALLPAARARIFGPHAEHAAALAAEQNEVRTETWVEPAGSAREAVAGAEVVISVATLGATTERITPEWLRPGTLVVAVDFATYVDPDVAHRARQFVTDDREQFLHYRSLGYFDGYPEPEAVLGELADDWPNLRNQPEPSDTAAPTLVTHLGVGLADVLFADAIRREAERQGAGVELPR
jgi:ornithine cyclodeaminase/alanine dehydrogenase-like protein (mu-crystallin family)